MKKLLYAFIVISLIITANSCKKSGEDINPFSDISNFGIGSYLTLDSSVNLNLDITNIAASSVDIMVSQYPGGESIDHILIYAASSTTYDTTEWHLVKSVSYGGEGTELSVTGAELGTALGVDPTTFPPGSSYTFYTRIVTKSGKTYDVNNTGDNDGSGLVTGANYYSAFSFTAYVVCPFTGGMTGTYVVVRDDWADWAPGDIVTVTDGPGANQINLSQVWPNPDYGNVINPLVVDIDPATGTASVPPVDFGDYGYIASSLSGSGYVFSCVGTITLTIDVYASGYGDQGPLKLILQKQ